MTISLVSTVQTSEGTPATHSAITGIATGDLYIDLAHNTGGGTAPALDATSTFTTIDSGTDWAGRTYAYGYRKRTGSEGTLAATGAAALVDIFFGLTGVDTTTQVESVTTTSSVGTTYTVAASTPTANNCWHVLVISDTNSDATSIPTPPTGYAQLATYKKTGQGTLWAFYKDLGAGSSGVSTGSITVTFSGGTAGGQAVGFIVRAASGGGATISTITGTTVTEGGNEVFTATMSGTGGGTFAYSWSGTATGSGTDYTSTLTTGMCAVTGGSGNVTVSGSNITVDSTVTAFTVTVPTTDDALNEAAETIRLVIGGVTASSGTINDNDAQPSISVNDVTQSGGFCTFTVSLSAASGQTVTVDYATANGTKTAGVDYTAKTGTLTFAAGETTKTVAVSVP